MWRSEAAIDNVGYALGLVQMGGLRLDAKPSKGEGPEVFEIVEDQLGSRFRAVYTVRFQKAVYGWHGVQKKLAAGHPHSENRQGRTAWARFTTSGLKPLVRKGLGPVPSHNVYPCASEARGKYAVPSTSINTASDGSMRDTSTMVDTGGASG